MKMDKWDRKTDFGCSTCMMYVPKIEHSNGPGEGRCRRNAPTMKGYPVVFACDWCGEHKRGSNPVRDAKDESGKFKMPVLEAERQFGKQTLPPKIT